MSRAALDTVSIADQCCPSSGYYLSEELAVPVSQSCCSFLCLSFHMRMVSGLRDVI